MISYNRTLSYSYCLLNKLPDKKGQHRAFPCALLSFLVLFTCLCRFHLMSEVIFLVQRAFIFFPTHLLCASIDKDIAFLCYRLHSGSSIYCSTQLCFESIKRKGKGKLLVSFIIDSSFQFCLFPSVDLNCCLWLSALSLKNFLRCYRYYFKERQLERNSLNFCLFGNGFILL